MNKIRKNLLQLIHETRNDIIKYRKMLAILDGKDTKRKSDKSVNYREGNDSEAFIYAKGEHKSGRIYNIINVLKKHNKFIHITEICNEINEDRDVLRRVLTRFCKRPNCCIIKDRNYYKYDLSNKSNEFSWLSLKDAAYKIMKKIKKAHVNEVTTILLDKGRKIGGVQPYRSVSRAMRLDNRYKFLGNNTFEWNEQDEKE